MGELVAQSHCLPLHSTQWCVMLSSAWKRQQMWKKTTCTPRHCWRTPLLWQEWRRSGRQCLACLKRKQWKKVSVPGGTLFSASPQTLPLPLITWLLLVRQWVQEMACVGGEKCRERKHLWQLPLSVQSHFSAMRGFLRRHCTAHHQCWAKAWLC